MSQLIQVDSLRGDQVAARLRQVAATEQPQHNKPGKRYFYSKDYETWIILKGGPSGTFVLEYYKGCPCGS